MDEKRINCLSGYEVVKNEIEQWGGGFYHYTCDATGEVKISFEVYDEITKPENKAAKEIIAGIFRNCYENKIIFKVDRNGAEIDYIDLKLITDRSYEHQFEYPKDFNEKAIHLLKYFYNKGGKDHRYVDLYLNRDFPLIYSNQEDLTNVIYFLEDERKRLLLEVNKEDTNHYLVRLTSNAIKKLEKNEQIF